MKWMSESGSARCVWPRRENSISGYCFGEFREEDRFAFERHLLECSFCWAEVQRLDEMIRCIQTGSIEMRQWDSEIVSMIGISARIDAAFGGHIWHVLTVAALYALMLAGTVFMELAYAFDQYRFVAWTVSPAVLIWSFAAMVAALAVDTKVTRAGRSHGIAASVFVLVFAATFHYLAVRQFLPAVPITQASFQTWPAQAAYLKGVVYCTAFAVFFVVPAFHFVITMQREIQAGAHRAGLDLLTRSKTAVAPRGAPHLPLWLLCAVLAGGAVYSIASSAHLLEALKTTTYSNLFVQAVQIRWLLFLALGAECCWWYYSSAQELKRECVIMQNLAGQRPEGYR
jgi:hypothetical protein